MTAETQPMPHTVGSLAADLRDLGLSTGDTVLVHASTRSLGFVAGRVQAVVRALLEVVGPGGTLAVPTHTPFNSDPAGWRNPPVPPRWWPVIREQSPGFDPRCTPSQHMGVLAETVRTWPGAVRSGHPSVSFAAVGDRARAIVGGHRLDQPLGENSPVGALYRAHGKVLLLGCGHDRNTSLHLAESRRPQAPMMDYGAAVADGEGGSRWVTWTAPVTDASDFPVIGAAYEAVGAIAVGPVGSAVARLMPQRDVVDFATSWMEDHRPPKTACRMST
ncbi:aminoglycoside 3'-phosphotransferase [Actinoplanes sp. SE50]|uniref:aminoglycoside N(3)-acetyltransferase n=1 Tax=unclassified Actinoplanes TaxID=2626549 RepID=UPI00023EBD47|nr:MULTISPECIES: AAC(3) family N-acetyltransferase [unclassified Actinoplanes]AEV84536.1 aminoglycoside N3'-acetyltransferase [Actinoplanes sp. SE50/110]ATO82928.1 aminoglycoside 3'-phosphotransferase [Actinoplanes sp. SE50]SLM00336.1 AAC(3) family N-acetyltransferase [Actinoplanes sp. SE50/110]